MRELNILGTYNIRDLGGYAISDKKIMKYGALIRSGNLDKISETSQIELLDYGVKTIIDIRDEWEAEHYPNPFIDSTDLDYHNLPLIGDDLSNDKNFHAETRNCVELGEIYIKYIDKCQPQIGRIISSVADSETGIVIHCQAGKDRTGIIVALILATIGISDEDIETDYALSNQNIQHLISEWRVYEESNGGDMEQFERKVASIPKTILNVLGHVRQNYGSVDDYLLRCGLSNEQLLSLQMKFFQ